MSENRKVTVHRSWFKLVRMERGGQTNILIYRNLRRSICMRNRDLSRLESCDFRLEQGHLAMLALETGTRTRQTYLGKSGQKPEVVWYGWSLECLGDKPNRDNQVCLWFRTVL